MRFIDDYILKLKSSYSQSGQIVLIVLLLLMVGMTIGISILQDTMTETSLTVTEEGSEDSFNAAEAAIENVLLKDYANIGADTVTIKVGSEEMIVDIKVDEVNNIEAKAVKQNSVLAVNTEGVSLGGANQLVIKWNDKSAYLYVERWYKLADGSIKVGRYVYQPYQASNPSALEAGDVSANASTGTGGYNSELTTNFNYVAGSSDIVVRIRPLFSDADIYVEGTDVDILPAQRKTIYSVPSSGSEVRAVQVDRYFGQLPDIFDYVLFSGGPIIKEN